MAPVRTGNEESSKILNLDRRGGVIPHRRLGDRLSRAGVHRTAVHRQLAHRTVRAAAIIAVYSALILRIP
eukprot:COSAG03_NODE_2471_length_2724_cov_2.428190_2_plen_70_part_00